MHKLRVSLVFIVGLIASEGVLAQQDVEDRKDTVYSRIFISQQEPEPPGGIKAFKQWVAANYKLPEAARKAGVNGKIGVTFIVELNGELSDIKALTDLGYGTGEAVEKLFQKSPPWKPGEQSGKPLRVRYLFFVPVN